jgi:hypothetical protein
MLAFVGLVSIAFGLFVLSGFFSNSERDAPAVIIVGGVVVLLLAPGILAILGSLHLFRRSRA